MKTKLLTLLGMFLMGGAAQALSIAPKDAQDPSYQLNRLDNVDLKSYLGEGLKHSTKMVGVIDADDADYSDGVPGTYDLQDSVSGVQIVLPAGSVIRDAYVYAQASGTSGVTVAVGHPGSVGAIVAARDFSSLTAGVLTAGVQVSAATAIATSTQMGLKATLTGVTLNAGKVYVIMDVVKGLQ